MGVRGLQTFMEKNCPDVAYEVNIKDIIDTYRRETGKEVVIVVDGSSCLRHLYGRLDWVCGGQIKEYVEIFQNFIQAFVNLGAKLVFFFDGPTQPRKRKVWIERRLKSLGDAYKVFDLIERGVPPSHITGDIVMLPPATTYLASHAIKTAHGCEIHRTVKECDEEIAEYARQHNCFAILGQDSDYVIYDGPQYYLSASHLNLERMTTKNYNRWELARHLRLPPGLLPLLASLVGNDIVRYDDLEHFHKRICNHKNPHSRPNPRDAIYNVARFIRDIDEKHLYEALPQISRRVFGNESKASHIETSVRSYIVNSQLVRKPERPNLDAQPSDAGEKWKLIQKYAEMRFKDGDLDSMVYAVMHSLPFESSTGLEDFRRGDLPPSAAVYVPLRQRIYGVVLYEQPGDSESSVVEEWCMQGEYSLNEAAQVPVTLPKSGSHPGLLALWNEKDTSEELKTKKWVLLVQAVSSKLDVERVRFLPPTLLAPTLLLFFLCNEAVPTFLEPWETEAFIATAVMLPTHTSSSLANIHVGRVVTRAVQLALIFMRGSSLIKMLMDACGRPLPPLEVSAWHYFDGKLFQTMYQKAQSGRKIIDLCNHQGARLEEFNLIRSIIFSS